MREVTLSQLVEAASRGEPWTTDVLTGTSPGPVGAALGISRQRVHQLLESGALEGYRLVDRKGNLAAILISDASFRRRLRERRSAA